MKNVLVVCHGFIGDSLFASSLAKKLKEDEGFDVVDYCIRFCQPEHLLNANPWIDNVHTSAPGKKYNKIIELGEISQDRPVTIQYQEQAELKNPTIGYEVFTVETLDHECRKKIEGYRKDFYGFKVVAWQSNWSEKSFLFTEYQYDTALDVPYLGYGGAHRNIQTILSILKESCILIEVGFPSGITQDNPIAADSIKFARDASMIKYCDFMIGSEGGLTNLSAGMGTRTIITTDFIWQLYGPRGSQKQFQNPQMGPQIYFPEANHVHLNPFLTDEQVGDEILKIITENSSPHIPLQIA